MLNTIVSALGHGVDFVSDGDAAVKAVSGSGYDLVLMDVVLPGLNGVEATRRIRAFPGAPARLPIIGISGRSDAAEEKAARQAGMTEYLVKPISAATLAEAIAATQRP
jgi:CheY-like chemotaxis protein